MDQVKALKIAIPILVIAFLYHPYLLLFANIGKISLPQFEEIFWAFKNTAIQTGLSVTLSLFFGTLATFGSLYLIQSKFKFLGSIQILLVIPSILPSIVLITYFFKFFSFVPPGNFAIAIVQSFVGATLVASTLTQLWPQRFGNLTALAKLEGSSRLQLLTAIFPLILKDWLRIGSALVLAFWTSFAIPLLIGGSSGTNLEVLIFEKMRISLQWDQAIGLSLSQASVIALFFYFNPVHSIKKTSEKSKIFVLPSPMIAIVLSVVLVTFFGSLIYLLAEGVFTLSKTPGLIDELIRTSSMTLFTFFISFSIFVILFFAILGVYLVVSFEKISRSYLAPSTALLAVAYGSIANLSNFQYAIYLAAAVFYFFIPAYQLYFQDQFGSLKNQIVAAQLMGAHSFKILVDVLWPQSQKIILAASFIASAWLIMDFTLPRFFLEQNVLWASLASSLLQSYRIDAAFGVIGLLLLTLVVLYFFLQGALHVSRKTFK